MVERDRFENNLGPDGSLPTGMSGKVMRPWRKFATS